MVLPASLRMAWIFYLSSRSSGDRIRERIQNDISTEQAAVKANRETIWKTTATTPVGVLIRSLSEKTSPSELTLWQSFLRRIGTPWQLNETLKSNPKQKAKETRAVATS